MLVAGCDVPVPPLLGRQSVVLGVSNGIIRKPDFTASASQAKRAAAAPAAVATALTPAAGAGPDIASIQQVGSKTSKACTGFGEPADITVGLTDRGLDRPWSALTPPRSALTSPGPQSLTQALI